jgi:hypothetical protein
MEATAFARQQFGQTQQTGGGIVAAQRTVFQRGDADGQAVRAAQALGDGVVGLGRGGGADLGKQRLGRRFEGGKVVGAFGEEVTRLLGGQRDPAPRCGR